MPDRTALPPTTPPITPPIRIVAISGSIRRGSWNRKLLEAARTLAPAGVDVDMLDLAGLPFYDADLDTDAARPAAVESLKRRIADADGVLFATPEFNHSIPGVLQNAIDWVSRPAMRSPLADKPVAIMGSSPGALGATRAQQHLKLVLMATMSQIMPHQGVAVGAVHTKFDADGRLTDDTTRTFLAQFVAQFADWIRRVGATRPAGQSAAPGSAPGAAPLVSRAA